MVSQVPQNWEPDVGDDIVVIGSRCLGALGKLHIHAAIKPWAMGHGSYAITSRGNQKMQKGMVKC